MSVDMEGARNRAEAAHQEGAVSGSVPEAGAVGLYPPGVGYIRALGWDENDTGESEFRAIVVFPNGPPNFRLMAVLRQWPATISVADPSSASETKVLEESPAPASPSESSDTGRAPTNTAESI